MEPLLVKHLETYLGTILHGWSVDADGDAVPFQVVQLGEEKKPSLCNYATLGLSKYSLLSRTSGKTIRCELVMAVKNDGNAMPGILQQVGKELIHSGHALLRGDVIGPRNPLITNSSMCALYASIPIFFPKPFASCDSINGQVVFIWLVPISQDEADYVKQYGWDAFEKTLDNSAPDLTDLFRASVVS